MPSGTDAEPSSSALALPASLAGCVPVLWNRVLFPGVSAGPSRIRWSALFLLIVLPGLLLYPCLAFPLFEPDEGRYAEIPREMLARGEWVVPTLQGEPYLDKPPLLYWLVMLSYRVLGVHDWAARLVPALAVHACVLLTYLLGRRSLGERAAFWGAGAGAGAGLLEHGPAAAARRPADMLCHAVAPRRLRGAARAAPALGLVAARGRGVRARRADQGAGRPACCWCRRSGCTAG